MGRSAERAVASAEALRQEALEANAAEMRGEVIGLAVDMADAGAIEALWERFRGGEGDGKEKTVIDVLVLNAAGFSLEKPILELGTDRLWKDFEVNVRSQFYMAERFYKQAGKPVDRPLVCSIRSGTRCPVPTFPPTLKRVMSSISASNCRYGLSGGKHIYHENGHRTLRWLTCDQYLVHVSSISIHDWNASPQRRGYAASKQAGATALQMIALETPARDMQIVNFHPGPNYTQAAKDAGYSLEDYAWNDGTFQITLAITHRTSLALLDRKGRWG